MNQRKSILCIFIFSICLTAVFTCITAFGNNPFTGSYHICMHPSGVFTNYFSSEIGGLSGSFLNCLLVQIVMYFILVNKKNEVNHTSFLAYFLTLGFTFWGINILNIWFGFFGIFIYKLVCHKSYQDICNTLLFSTGIAPLYSTLLFQYPLLVSLPFIVRMIFVLIIACIGGFIISIVLHDSKRLHEGFSLLGAGWPVGVTCIILYTLLYRIVLGSSLSSSAIGLDESHLIICLIYIVLFCGGLLIYGLYKGGLQSFQKLWKDSGYQANYFTTYGIEATCINIGIYGLFIFLYFFITKANFNGVTFGCIFCMISLAASGSHIRNVLPILFGYVIIYLITLGNMYFLQIEPLYVISSQAIVAGSCYATGLSPISGKYGWIFGIVVGMLHCMLVTQIPALHGALCLYNGGFTSCLTAIIALPFLKYFNKSKMK